MERSIRLWTRRGWEQPAVTAGVNYNQPRCARSSWPLRTHNALTVSSAPSVRLLCGHELLKLWFIFLWKTSVDMKKKKHIVCLIKSGVMTSASSWLGRNPEAVSHRKTLLSHPLNWISTAALIIQEYLIIRKHLGELEIGVAESDCNTYLYTTCKERAVLLFCV